MAGRATKDAGGAVASPLMPGARVREDGWTLVRVTKFLAVLAERGCVTDAARVVGLSRTSVNRARERYAPFDKACRAALAQSLRGLEAVAYQRAVAGKETIIIRKGEEVERRISPSDAMLKLLIQRGDLSGAGQVARQAGGPVNSRGEPLGPDDYITLEEHEAGWEWMDGVKTDKYSDPRTILAAKIAQMRERITDAALEEGRCWNCQQPLTDAARTFIENRQMKERESAKVKYGPLWQG